MTYWLAGFLRHGVVICVMASETTGVLGGVGILLFLILGVLAGVFGITWTVKMLADDYRAAAASDAAKEKVRRDAEVRDIFLQACLTVEGGGSDSVGQCADSMMEQRSAP